ncbi:MAG: ribonuclease P protein component [Aphanocapsa lilacina HA4352-LM1]|nr:ribonuclease P protein component [Aphanocapsa lilacina HA4352-LM1]
MLPGEHRLRARRDFELVHRRAKRYTSSHLQLLVLKADPAPTRVGITTSRKVGNAVRRNRYRRLIRESLRRVLLKLASGYKIVIVVRPQLEGAFVPSYGEICEQVNGLLVLAGLLPSGTNTRDAD